ncbi:MAG: porin family protein [Desulfuromonadales bacterium]|nr:porin family protein [Desulfuromonadales bacterium]
MNLRVMLAGLLLSVSASTAMAAGPYVGASGGVSIFHDQDIKRSSGPNSTAELKTGYGFNVSAGYNFDPVRVEFEFGYKNADVDKFTAGGASSTGSGSDTTIMSYMADAYFDFKNSSKFTPYVGVGLGALNGEFKSPGFKSDDTVFGYQFSVGAAYNVSKNVALDLSYRFQGAASDFAITGGSDVSYMSSDIMAGLRYNF